MYKVASYMPTVFELGPCIASIDISAVVPVPVVGKVGITFGTPATLPDGTVNVVLGTAANPGDVLPVNLYAFFVPVAAVPVPPAPAPDANFFFASGAPVSSVPVVAGKTDYAIAVAGVPPGFHYLQTILEYPAPAA